MPGLYLFSTNFEYVFLTVPESVPLRSIQVESTSPGRGRQRCRVGDLRRHAAPGLAALRVLRALRAAARPAGLRRDGLSLLGLAQCTNQDAQNTVTP